MDPLSGATTLATLVSLVGQFVGSRADRAERGIEEFRDWLGDRNQGEAMALLEANTRTTIAIKALLQNDREQLASKLNGLFGALAHVLDGIGELSGSLRELENLPRAQGQGGAGGSGKIFGDTGTIIGGRGGAGGTSGIGGAGGSGEIHGDGGTIIGGDGGNAGTADGRGGRGARGPTERLGFQTDLWGYGRGGSGANHPEYERRLTLMLESREEYMARFPEERRFIEAGVDHVPSDWINQRLAERGERWQVSDAYEGGYILPALIEDE